MTLVSRALCDKSSSAWQWHSDGRLFKRYALATPARGETAAQSVYRHMCATSSEGFHDTSHSMQSRGEIKASA